jgi:thiamine biosynthesis lipoprotein
MTTAAMATASWQALGTTALVRVTNERHLELAKRLLTDELLEIDRAASNYRSDSELCRLLEADGRTVTVTEALRRAVLAALTAARLTDGIVDPTLGHQPGWRGVEVTDTTVRMPAGAPLDLGATGKALAADRAAAAISNATHGGGVLVSLGGDIATAGQPPAGGWQIHVTDDHRSDHTAPGQTVAIHGGALATSGTTVRRGPNGHHIIDPRTGASAQTPWRTVSVTAASCVDANTASTAAIILGHEAPRWLEQHGLAARLVDNLGSVTTLGGWPRDPGEQR